jgi:type I restriction enzyme S subunit
VKNFHNIYQVKGPGVITGRSGTIGKVHYVNDDYWPHNTSLWVKQFNNAIPKYVYYLYTYIGFDRFSSGSGVPTLNRNDAHSFTITVPIKKEEQTAIANALSDVDALLTELENLIDKKQAIKTATMQQLLTGKTRLPQFATYTKGEKQDVPEGMIKGTKPSELGQFPEDWDVSPLQKLTVMMTNGFVGTAKAHYTDRDDGITYIQGYNVLENRFNFRGIKKVTKEFHQRQSKSNLRTGDVLMVQTGDVGLTTIIPESLAGSNCHALIISRFKTKLFDPLYFSYYLNSQEGRARLKDIEIGTTMKHINVGDLLHFEVPVPSTIEEQTAIATILSDMDNDIQILEQRLTKTRQIKQGMMQQLLTGRTRLPFDSTVKEKKGVANAN